MIELPVFDWVSIKINQMFVRLARGASTKSYAGTWRSRCLILGQRRTCDRWISRNCVRDEHVSILYIGIRQRKCIILIVSSYPKKVTSYATTLKGYACNTFILIYVRSRYIGGNKLAPYSLSVLQRGSINRVPCSFLKPFNFLKLSNVGQKKAI